MGICNSFEIEEVGCFSANDFVPSKLGDLGDVSLCFIFPFTK